MGYCTNYSIDVRNPYNCEPINGKLAEKIIRELQSETGYYATRVYFHEAKWYSHEGDVKNFSTKYPDYLFVLTGVGETTGDMWVKYFHNGKHYKEELTCIEYDCRFCEEK